MLTFDSLELVGFKSFAEKTRLKFDHGITGIIGPNGCGKSNITDAIGWVLGIQNARSLRGQKMEDLIFGGTKSRKASGFCQVNLTLRVLGDPPAALAEDLLEGGGVEIGRKLYRSGESIYLLNQRRCRLKDIHRFIDAAGLGFASYALIAQGEIDSFLSLKPLDRRNVIEEAAGISGYKSRRRNAEMKLELAQQNLVRVTDIILEVERQLRSLKRQAAKARRYRELKDEFRAVQAKKLTFEVWQVEAQMAALDDELQKFSQVETQLRNELHQQEAAAQESSCRRDELEKRLGEMREARSGVVLELERCQHTIRHHGDQKSALLRQTDSNAAEGATIAAALEKASTEEQAFVDEVKSLTGEEERVLSQIRDSAERLEHHQEELRLQEEQIEQLRADLLRLSGEIASLRNQREQLERFKKSHQAVLERLNRELLTRRQQLEATRQRLADQDKELASIQAQETELNAQLLHHLNKKQEVEAESSQIQSEVDEIHHRLISCRERLQSLEELEVSRSQYSEGVQQFLKHLSATSSVHSEGTLADFIETSPEFERLVEEFLDEELEFVLVEDLDEALKGISELKSVKGGRCTFLSLRSQNGFGRKASGESLALPEIQGVYGTLGELLKMKPQVEEAFARALPQLARAIVVSDLEQALKLSHDFPEATFLTLQGESMTPRGLVSGSALQTQKLGLLGLKRQKRELEKRLWQLQKSHEKLVQVKDDLKRNLQQVSQDHAAAQESFHQIEKEVLAALHRLEELRKEEERELRALRVLTSEEEEARREALRLQEQASEVQLRLEGKEGLQKELETSLETVRRGIVEQRAEHQFLQEQHHGIVSNQKIFEERLQAARRNLARAQEDRDVLQKRKKKVEDLAREAQQQLSEIAGAIESFNLRLLELGSASQRLESEWQELEQTFQDWKDAHPRLEQAVTQTRELLSASREKRTTLEVERARSETRLEHLSQQALEILQQPLSSLPPMDSHTTKIEQVEADYRDLKTRLEDFGPINMTALEEYQELTERFEFLSRQKGDIEQSVQDTTRAIAELNRRSRLQFQEAYQAINRNFREVFQKLFEGGECGLELLDEEDPLESGIDISAQPPGKRLQNVMLLSGGEKALTVLALLVGIFMFRPSRFCILDEVDAPLDDANVNRFVRLVEELSVATQFILVTHNKRTMELADSLFGVTMEEAGVSRVVSVSFGPTTVPTVASA